MATINIGQANADDQFYRYKMPKLQARIEGRGNGIKTNVVNNVEIAKALERPPDYIIKFFGNELGAVTKYDKSSGTSIVNGAHDSGVLSKLLEVFINTYVQCYACRNPETQVKVKRENILLKCKACGFVSDVDARHKLNTFILKNPPEEKMSKAEKKMKKMEQERLKEAAGDNLDKEEKRRRKKEKDSKKKSGDGGKNGDDEDDDDDEGGNNGGGKEVVWMTDTSAAAARKRAEEQLSDAMAGMVTQGNIEAEQAEQRKREKEERKRIEEEQRQREADEAEAQRRADEEAAAAKVKEEEERAAAEAAKANGTASNGTSAATAEAVDAMRKVLAKTKSAGKVSEALRGLQIEGGPAGMMRVLYEGMLLVLEQQMGGGLTELLQVLYQALFAEDEETRLGVQVAKRKLILQAVGDDNTSQIAQLLALEYLVGVTAPHRLGETILAATMHNSSAEISQALKALYDEDIVEEDLILAWADKPVAGKVLGIPAATAKAVREAAAKFVEWLKEADEDEDSEEDDDSLAGDD
eukprot:jgi/Astpho2/5345/Aster-05895